MVRTIWFTLVAVAAALAMTVGTSAAAPSKEGNCPGHYQSADAALYPGYDDNSNGWVCLYQGKDPKKDPVIDDNGPPKK